LTSWINKVNKSLGLPSHNNNNDNLYGAVMQPYRYNGDSHATKQGKP